MPDFSGRSRLTFQTRHTPSSTVSLDPEPGKQPTQHTSALCEKRALFFEVQILSTSPSIVVLRSVVLFLENDLLNLVAVKMDKGF